MIDSIIKVSLVIAALLAFSACYAFVKTAERTSVDIVSVDCESLLENKAITADNPLECRRLREVSFHYLGFDNTLHEGKLVVIDVVAPHVYNLMQELLDRKFLISKAVPIEVYGGDDQASMAANNTSAFNGRAVSGGDRWSMHAYGAAIDINPVQNPFIEIDEDGSARISPEASARYSVNRLDRRPNKEPRPGLAEDVVETFAKHGFFIWGGDWNYPIDYQHFQIGPRLYIEKLASRGIADGSDQINRSVGLYAKCKSRLNQRSRDARQRCVEEVLADMQKF